MGWLKKAAKWVAKKAKALVRVVVRVVMTAVGLGLGIVDIFFGWAAWPPKKLRLHIVVLSNQTGLSLKSGCAPPSSSPRRG